LMVNSIVHHAVNDYGDAFSGAERESAKKQLTAEDVAALRQGG
jgi:hypothetical protein